MNTSKTIDQLIRDWLENLNVSTSTVKLYKSTIIFWFKFLDQARINKHTPRRRDVLAYKNQMLAQGRNPFTINNYLAAVRSFYHYLEEEKIYENIATNVSTRIKYRKHRRDNLTREAQAKLLSFETQTLEDHRDKLLIKMMLVLGLRRAEAHGIQYKDIKPTGHGYTLAIKRKGRTSKEDFINIPPGLLRDIQEYIRITPPGKSSFLFQNHKHKNNPGLTVEAIGNIINRRLKAAGLKTPKVTTHSLRHTAATNAYKNGATIYELQKLLGHSSIESTRAYLMTIDEENYLNNPAVFNNDKTISELTKTAINAI